MARTRGGMIRRLLWRAYGPVPVTEIVRPTLRWLTRRANHNQLDALRSAFEILRNVAELREEVEGLSAKLTPVNKKRIKQRLTTAEDKLQEALTLVIQALSPENGLSSTTLYEAVQTLRAGRQAYPAVDTDPLEAAITDAKLLFDE